MRRGASKGRKQRKTSFNPPPARLVTVTKQVWRRLGPKSRAFLRTHPHAIRVGMGKAYGRGVRYWIGKPPAGIKKR